GFDADAIRTGKQSADRKARSGYDAKVKVPAAEIRERGRGAGNSAVGNRPGDNQGKVRWSVFHAPEQQLAIDPGVEGRARSVAVVRPLRAEHVEGRAAIRRLCGRRNGERFIL